MVTTARRNVTPSGAESFLRQIREEIVTDSYRPMRARKKEIPKDAGTKVRVLSIPSIGDRVVQGALKLRKLAPSRRERPGLASPNLRFADEAPTNHPLTPCFQLSR
jgi:hypothetical protein